MQLEEKLRAERRAGILAWMIDGCLDWQHNGLVRPQVVVEATAEYFDAQDLLPNGSLSGARRKPQPPPPLRHCTTTGPPGRRRRERPTGHPEGVLRAGWSGAFRKKRTNTGAIFLGLRLLPSETGVWHG